MKRTNPDFLNGVPELLVLKLLARKPMYGYELVQSLRRLSEEALAFGEGCIYPILHKLEADKLLSGKRETVAGRERLVYRLTAAGKKRLGESQTAWQRIARAISHVLEGDADVAPKLA